MLTCNLYVTYDMTLTINYYISSGYTFNTPKDIITPSSEVLLFFLNRNLSFALSEKLQSEIWSWIAHLGYSDVATDIQVYFVA